MNSVVGDHDRDRTIETLATLLVGAFIVLVGVLIGVLLLKPSPCCQTAGGGDGGGAPTATPPKGDPQPKGIPLGMVWDDSPSDNDQMDTGESGISGQTVELWKNVALTGWAKTTTTMTSDGAGMFSGMYVGDGSEFKLVLSGCSPDPATWTPTPSGSDWTQSVIIYCP